MVTVVAVVLKKGIGTKVKRGREWRRVESGWRRDRERDGGRERETEAALCADPCLERQGGAWRLVRGRILRAPNWDGWGHVFWEREGEREVERGRE